MTTLILDSDIRDWVVLPLFVIMVATGLLRHYVSVLLRNDPVQTSKMQQRTQSLLRCTSKLKSGSSNYISNWKFSVRRSHYVKLLKDEANWCVQEEEQQKLAKEQQQEQDGSDNNNAATDPNDPMAAMMNPMSMMKGNMVFMAQNMIMMQGISHFFSGFILLKIPFPLTVGFKPMFQRGLIVENNALDTSYVSSVSWYFLVMFGLRGFFRLAIGDMSFESKQSNKYQQKLGYMMQMNPTAGNPDAAALSKNLNQEAENLEYFLQVPPKLRTIDTVEKRLLRDRYPKKQKSSSSSGSAGGISSSIVSDDFLMKKKKKKQ